MLANSVNDPRWGTEIASALSRQYRSFIMPYRDVTLIIEWGPDGASTTPTEDLALGKARAEAVDAINNAYAGYKC